MSPKPKVPSPKSAGVQPLFDACAGIGDLMGMPPGCRGTPEELLAEMDRLSIGRALVWSRACLAIDPLLANGRMDEAVGGERRLVRAWTAVPESAGNVPKADAFVKGLLASGARAAKCFPVTMHWSTEAWCAGSLFSALEARRVPAIFPFGEIALPALESVLACHPKLPVILSEVGYRENRSLYALMASRRNLFLDSSPPYSVHLGLEIMSAKGLIRQFLFGTAWPKCDAGPAISQLMYAEIPEKERDDVAQGTLERLLSEVRA